MMEEAYVLGRILCRAGSACCDIDHHDTDCDMEERVMPTIKCTRKQLDVIRNACEEYGRVRLGQFFDISTDLALLGYEYKENDPEFNRRINARNDLHTMLSRWFQETVGINYDRDPNEMIAMDIWAVLDGRREGTGFVLGSEPQVVVKEDEA